jgi:putative oxidoreductase
LETDNANHGVSFLKLAPLPLRLALGMGLIYHGMPKLTLGGHRDFVGMLQSSSVPLPEFSGWLVGAFEVIGGSLLVLGMWTAVVATLGVIEMTFAMVAVHLPYGFSFINIVDVTESGPEFGMPGYEVNLLYIAGFLSLMAMGSGAFSIEALRANRIRDHDRATARSDPRPGSHVRA